MVRGDRDVLQVEEERSVADHPAMPTRCPVGSKTTVPQQEPASEAAIADHRKLSAQPTWSLRKRCSGSVGIRFSKTYVRCSGPLIVGRLGADRLSVR